MRSGIEHWLLNIWYSRPQPPWYLRMLEPVYRAGFSFDHRASQKQPDTGAISVPVIVVGNITVGGSGKTPLVIALTKLAQALQLSVGIATTGYGRKSDQTFLVHASSDPELCGDEPVLLSARTSATVVVAKNRPTAVTELNNMGVDLIISDDGLQTAGFQRDLEICVVDGARGFGNGHLLPAGPLRESQERLSGVDCIISNGKWSGRKLPFEMHEMTLAGDTFCTLDDSQSLSANEFFEQQAGSPVHAVAAIGNPDRFYKALRQLELLSGQKAVLSTDWQEHQFADHHAYTQADFEGINGEGSIVMTEKDAVKCRKLGLENAWYLPVDAQLSEAFENWFRRQLTKLKTE